MLPTQILLNNFYDLSQVTIPTDNVDASFMESPTGDIGLIRDFMISLTYQLAL
jgi:Mg2+-importing ATPase